MLLFAERSARGDLTLLPRKRAFLDLGLAMANLHLKGRQVSSSIPISPFLAAFGDKKKGLLPTFAKTTGPSFVSRIHLTSRKTAGGFRACNQPAGRKMGNESKAGATGNGVLPHRIAEPARIVRLANLVS